MRELFAIVAVVLLVLFIAGCTSVPAHTKCGTAALTDSRVREIGIAEFRRRGGVFVEGYWEMRVTREGCQNVFFALARPAAPGRYFAVTIDDLGRVVEYTPGL